MSPSSRGAASDGQGFLSTPGAGKELLSCPKRHTIYRQGDRATSVYFVVRGSVKLCATSPVGKEAVAGVLGPGELFGEACLLSHKVRTGSAVCVAPSEIIRISRDTLLTAVHRFPEIGETVLRQVLRRTAQYEDALLHQLFDNSERRLARVLLQLAGYNPERPDSARREGLIRHISQATLAEMVGTTRPRINGFMTKFRSLGHIAYDEGSVRVQPSLLQVLSHETQARVAVAHGGR